MFQIHVPALHCDTELPSHTPGSQARDSSGGLRSNHEHPGLLPACCSRLAHSKIHGDTAGPWFQVHLGLWHHDFPRPTFSVHC